MLRDAPGSEHRTDVSWAEPGSEALGTPSNKLQAQSLANSTGQGKEAAPKYNRKESKLNKAQGGGARWRQTGGMMWSKTELQANEM